jgi:cytochrome c5
MTLKNAFAVCTGIFLLTSSLAAQAGDGDWKRGRVYYRMVCTSCHEKNGGSIAPNTKTKAEWATYLQADKHAKGKDTIKYYVSKDYRGKAKASNKAAEKFIDLPDQELLDDVRSFVTRGAKDGDSPAGCS